MTATRHLLQREQRAYRDYRVHARVRAIIRRFVLFPL